MVLEPISPEVLRQRLRSGAVQFAFKKLDGTLRTAVGTTNLTTIPSDHHPKGVRESSPRQVTFFDLEKQSWRSVSVNQEIFLSNL
jgi:hypothetical protein